jgi:hypothetical protein
MICGDKATGWATIEPWFNCQHKQEAFLFAIVHTSSEFHPAFYALGKRGAFFGGKLAE